MQIENPNRAVATLIIEELVRNGVSLFVVAPGNRSAPLLWGLQQRSDVTVVSAYDERSAAFFALGAAKATGQPAVVVTTSGTAVANLLPAALEARYDPTPLILLTADRPWELHHRAANQTIDQYAFLTPVVRWQGTIPAADTQVDAAAIVHLVSTAVAAAQFPLPGPVQLNCQFREPLHLQPVPFQMLNSPAFEQWQNQPSAFQQWRDVPVDWQVVHREIEHWLTTARDPVVIIGGMPPFEQTAVRAMCGQLSVPAVADITSGLRGKLQRELPLFDLALLHPSLWQWQPDRILWIGGRLTSKRTLQWLTTRTVEVLHLASVPMEFNPALQRMRHYRIPLASAAPFNIPDRPSFAERQQWIQKVIAPFKRALSDSLLTEATAIRTIFRQPLEEKILLLGNSIAVRDADSFVEQSMGQPVIVSNRGTSGIDGLVSTGAGAALAAGKQAVAIIGDLSALYDLNGFHFLTQLPHPMIVVVLNNGGGQIFTRVIPPIDRTDIALFVAPHSYDFADVAHLFGLAYRSVDNLAALEQQLPAVMQTQRSVLLEVKIDPDASIRWYEALKQLGQQDNDGEATHD